MLSKEVVMLAAEIASRKPVRMKVKAKREFIVMRHKNAEGISVVDKVSLAEVNVMFQKAWDAVFNKDAHRQTTEL